MRQTFLSYEIYSDCVKSIALCSAKVASVSHMYPSRVKTLPITVSHENKLGVTQRAIETGMLEVTFKHPFNK